MIKYIDLHCKNENAYDSSIILSKYKQDMPLKRETHGDKV